MAHVDVVEKYALPSRQICRKSSVEECIFDYMAFHIECRFNTINWKKVLLLTVEYLFLILKTSGRND